MGGVKKLGDTCGLALDLARLRAGIGQQCVDELGHIAGGMGGQLEQLAYVVAYFSFGRSEPTKLFDLARGCPQVVARDAREHLQLAKGDLKAILGCAQLFVALFQRLQQALALRHVAVLHDQVVVIEPVGCDFVERVGDLGVFILDKPKPAHLAVGCRSEHMIGRAGLHERREGFGHRHADKRSQIDR